MCTSRCAFGKTGKVSFLGQPGTYLTMWMLAELITVNSPALGMALKINTFVGVYTGLSVAILTGVLNVPKLFILLNPIVSTIVLMALKKCGVKIIGPLGVGFSMFAIVLLVAGMGV